MPSTITTVVAARVPNAEAAELRKLADLRVVTHRRRCLTRVARIGGVDADLFYDRWGNPRRPHSLVGKPTFRVSETTEVDRSTGTHAYGLQPSAPRRPPPRSRTRFSLDLSFRNFPRDGESHGWFPCIGEALEEEQDPVRRLAASNACSPSTGRPFASSSRSGSPITNHGTTNDNRDLSVGGARPVQGNESRLPARRCRRQAPRPPGPVSSSTDGARRPSVAHRVAHRRSALLARVCRRDRRPQPAPLHLG